jgi:hypothetical protein
MDAFIGSTFTFQALFLDPTGVPTVVTNPRISVFRYVEENKFLLVTNAVMVDPIPAEVGRYVYSYVIPPSLPDGTVIYAEMTADYLGLSVIMESDVNLISPDRGSGGSASGGPVTVVEAFIGTIFPFQALFVDPTGTPVVVTDPRITVFVYDNLGVKVPVVDNVSMLPAVPAEVGRYTYPYLIPNTMQDGQVMYAEMNGAFAGQVAYAATDLTLVSPDRWRIRQGGMTVRFVKGG